MSICAGVVVSVAFQQVDDAPNAETGTEGDDEGLENADSLLKNSIFVLPESLGVGCVEISRIQQEPERKLRCSPDSGFSFQILVHGFVPTLQARKRLFSSVSI